MDVRTTLRGLALDDELARLGVRDEDRPTILGWRDELLDDAASLARVGVLVERLAQLVGHPELVHQAFEEGDDQHRLGSGVLPLFALVLTAPLVRADHRAHDVDEATSDASLADLGQQVWKHRQVHGATGLHNHGWLTRVWAGRYLKLGRLQFELTTSTLALPQDPVAVLSVHIDESGPLTPEAVDDSLLQATTFFEPRWPEVGPVDWFVCGSWLLDPALAWRMPTSNVADFARRWTVWSAEPNDRDALYFGFGVEPENRALPANWRELPADTSLRRAALDIWGSGEHPMLCWGRIPVIAPLAEDAPA